MMWWSLFSLSASRFWTFLIFFPLLAPSLCKAQVVINEVYYDHPGKDDGWEFIEINNAGETASDISGWRLEFLDGVSGRKSTLWTASSGTIIEPKGFICISGGARNTAPEFLLTGAIGNGPDAVRLASPSGVIDVVGYGDVTLGDLYESSPAPDVDPGLSLSRKPDGNDTNRNDADFVASAPTPAGRNFFLRDISIAIDAEALLPCGGSPFSMTVKLSNCGIEGVTKRVSIRSSAIVAGHVISSEHAELDLDLSPSAVDSIAVTLVSPHAARFDIRVAVLDSPDENSSNDTACAYLGSSPGDVVLSEVMYRPGEGMSEWMELENHGGGERNLKSWTICDATGMRRLISDEDLFIPAGGFVILAQDSVSFAAEYPGCDAPVRSLERGWPSLNDADRGDFADIVELHDCDGVLVERVSYSNLLGSERGRSIERLSDEACSSLAGGIWHRCAARCGSTPGGENSTRSETTPRSQGPSIVPNPFCPRKDRETVITSALGAGETGFIVGIFNLDGLEIRRIFGENGGARVFSCRWDGRANEGSLVRTGLYVCLVEFVRTGGGVCRKEKKCIAVAAD